MGGGICGLWLLASLRSAGISAILLEKEALGCGQTLASQGMIHGGIKYTLGGFTTPASETIASMPERWRRCVAGRDSIDLRGVNLLSEDYYLFSDNRLSSRITAFFGSRSLRGRIEALSRKHFPVAFQNEAFNGTLYRLEDLVLDSASLLDVLTKAHRAHIFQASPEVITDSQGKILELKIGDGNAITAEHFIFAAGAGNAELLADTNLSDIEMQRRPLKQVLVRCPELTRIYAHAVAASAGAKPRVTITTHQRKDGALVWYLGGNLAETGVRRSNEDQIRAAKQEMTELFPWIDWTRADWATLLIDRAEPANPDRSRPDAPFFFTRSNATVCWPTKLTLTPLLADEVLAGLSIDRNLPVSNPDLPLAPTAEPPWETLLS